MLPLLTWAWPETPILIGITLLGALVLQIVAVTAISRVTRLALSRNEAHSSSITSRAARAVAQASGISTERHRQRTGTMASLLRSVATVVVIGSVLLTTMSILGIPLAPLLASAGVGGIALGFGAQSLVKDYLSGIFMIVEDQFGVGDNVDVGDVKGTVEEVSLRVTRIRDAGGMVWYVRNGEIVRVGNLSQGYSTGLVDIPVAIDEDAVRAIDVLKSVVAEVDGDAAWADKLLEPPLVLGVESIQGGTMTLRILIKCPPNQHYGVAREIRERAQVALAAAGVRGPKLPVAGS